MSTLNITPTYSNGNPLTEAQLTTFVEAVKTYFNTTKVDSENIRAASLQSYHIALSAFGDGLTASGIAIEIEDIPQTAIPDGFIVEETCANESIPLSAFASQGSTASGPIGLEEVWLMPSSLTTGSVSMTTAGHPIIYCSDTSDNAANDGIGIEGAGFATKRYAYRDGYALVILSSAHSGGSGTVVADLKYSIINSNSNTGKLMEIP